MKPRDESLNLHEHEQHISIEIMGMMPCLRKDLSVTVQSYAGETCYVIHDLLSSKFYRVGIAEYTFTSLLDGKTTIAEAMGHTASVMGADALSERETGTLCKWLLDSGLAVTSHSAGAKRLFETQGKEARKKIAGRLNPIMQKVPLFNPMPLLKPFDWLSRSIFGPLGILVWFCIAVAGIDAVWTRWDEFSTASTNLFSSGNWLWLLLTWIGLKLIHELSHAMACRRFHGNVREAGIVFIVFAPMPYVDVTSSWQVDSKWKRILISAAGMYAELLTAAIAAIVWNQSLDPVVRQQAINVIMTATVMTLLFNANPLMRFDGYYMLADWLEMPNLATHGRQWISYVSRRYFMGIPTECPQWPEGRHSIVVAYAILALCWRILISVSIILSAEILFHGAGIVFAALTLVLWIGIPLFRSVRVVGSSRHASLPRMASITIVSMLTVYSLWAHVPYHATARIPVIVDYHPAKEVRCGVDGFLVENSIRIGAQVQSGDVLARLNNPELELKRKDLELEVALTRQRQRDFRAMGAIAAVDIEEKNLVSLRNRLQQIKNQIAAMTIVATTDGTITSSDIESMEECVIKAGDRICVIGATGSEVIYGAVGQAEVDSVRARTGEQIKVHIWGSGTDDFDGTIAQVLPRATTELRHQALGAHVGGPLTVRPGKTVSQNEQPEFQLSEPHFTVLIDFAGCESENVSPGQCGYARFVYQDGTVGQVLLKEFEDWIHDKRQIVRDVTQTAQAKRLQILLSSFL